ncbi:response regulator transcription factor [Candidatus Collinsella stercoripullorum]|uniref:response regulator transcription factor n=1 Tax=Candidatus Collinsella stercoripullorum TaxID=2838522 RepID=UPI0022E8CA5A|nr:helix-turn-helix transcriptional regulator [Candidatus Collinsella stercoripullorum]
MSKRESEVLRLVLQGKSKQEIADELFLALGTVKTHVHNLLVKCDKKKRDDLILYFWQS